jgi:excisionase family DNA binding protein
MTGTPTTTGSGAVVGSGESLVSVDEAARRLGGISRTTLYKLAADGKLRLARVPGVRRTSVVESTLAALIAEAQL